jgi:hypothetical protein
MFPLQFLVAAFGVPSARGKMIKMNVIEAVLGALQQAKRLDIWCLMILHCFMASSEGTVKTFLCYSLLQHRQD